MGFVERLKEFGEGAVDLFSAPVGVLWDSARAITSSDYNPGIGGIFGQNLNKAVEGISHIGQATGVSALGAGIAEATPIDEAIGAIFKELELIYSTDYQRQEQKAPLGLGALGVQPGAVSLQRGASFATGIAGDIAGGLAPGGVTPTQAASDILDVSGRWKQTLNQSPGRALVDNAINFERLPKSEQDRLRAQTWYNLMTGTIDAVTRWYLQPEVLAGKGIKALRARRIPTAEALVKRANKAYRKMGISFEVMDEADGAINLQIKNAKGQSVYTVVRSSSLAKMREEGILRIPDGASELFDADQVRVGIRNSLDTRVASNVDPGEAVQLARNQMADEIEGLISSSLEGPLPPNIQEFISGLRAGTVRNPLLALDYFQEKGLARIVARENQLDDASTEIFVSEYLRDRFSEVPFTPATEAYDGLAQQVDRYVDYLNDNAFLDDSSFNFLVDAFEMGEAPDGLLNAARPFIEGLTDAEMVSRVGGRNAAQGVGWRTQRSVPGTVPEPSRRALYLLGEGDYDEAMRYAASLYEMNPDDLPVILKLDADGLPVAFEDYLNPQVIDPRSDLPSDASLITMADRIAPENITEVQHLTVNELDNTISFGKTTPGYLEPGGRVHNKLYHPDGSPIEPGDIVPWEDMSQDFLVASNLYGDSPLAASKYLRARAQQRALADIPESNNPVWRAMNHKSVQKVLNGMDGMSAEEIRRVYLPEHPFGGLLAEHLAAAKTYKDRRAVLAAAMGLKLPEFETLPDILRTRLRVLTEEFDRLSAGRAPDNRYLAMVGLDDLNLTNPDEARRILQETMDEVRDELARAEFTKNIAISGGALESVPVPARRRVLANYLRKQEWYQGSPLSRPVRSVIEKRPHQFVNVRDPMSDIQLVRQLEEASPVGISDAQVRSFHNRYLAAATEHEKLAILTEAEESIIEAAAAHAKMTSDELAELIRNARRGRRGVSEYLSTRRYGPDGTDVIEFFDAETGEVARRVMPLLSTQVQTWVPLADVREIIRVSSKIRRLKTRIGTVPKELMDQFNQIWKPTVLLRGGWMLRVVSDEQLRILAKTGSLLKHLAAIEAGEKVRLTSVFDKGLSGGQRTAAAFGTITGTQPLTSLGVRGAKVVAKGAKKLGLIDPEYARLVKEAGVEELVSSRASFGGPNESLFHQLQSLMGVDEATVLDHLIDRGTGQWRAIAKDDRLYGQAWLRALNDQIGRDPLARKMIETIYEGMNRGQPMGVTLQDAVDAGKKFLRLDKAGREIADRMPWRSTEPDKWMEELVTMFGIYTADFDPQLMKALASGKVSREILESIDEAVRPATVHAEIIDQSLGVSAVSQYMRDLISTSFDVLGRLPTDTLSRQPMFRHLYANEMMRLQRIASSQGSELGEAVIRSMSERARAFAITETKKYLYDLAEVSRFGHMMRFFMPFYPAWQEVLQVWGGLAWNDPSVIGRALLLWRAPNRANLVHTNDEGEEFIQLRLSEKTADNLKLTGWAKYLATGGVRFGKDSFNLVLNSPLPGVGPLIQMPVNEVVKNKPELEESLRFLLPFGVKTDTKDILLSPLVRQMASELRGPRSDKAYQRNFINALTWMDVEYRLGKRTTPPTVEEAHEVAKKLRTVRLVARLASPAQPIFDSPLQPYIDTYRSLIEEYGPDGADEKFLNEYGNEFFALTMSRTVSKTGLPPTVEAETARRQFEDLIRQYPEYGRLIVGDDALGEFSSAAFAAQLTRQVDPENPFSEPERAYRAVELDPRTGKIMEVDRRLGWQEYIQYMDLIDLERRKRGLPNLRVKEAQDLAAIKRSVAQALADKYPSWWDDFNTRDDLKWDKRIEAFKALAGSELLQDRPDIEAVSVYLEYRSLILQELNRRKQLGGAATLTATSNQDLATVWETVIAKILEDYVEFGPVYYRYLEGDPVRLSN